AAGRACARPPGSGPRQARRRQAAEDPAETVIGRDQKRPSVLSHATALPPSPAWADCLSRGGPHLLPRHSRPSGTGYRRSTPAQASRPARYLRFLLRSNEDFTPPHAGLAKESPELCPSTSTTRSIMETMRAVTDEEDEAVVRRDPPAERRTHDASGTSIARRCWR